MSSRIISVAVWLSMAVLVISISSPAGGEDQSVKITVKPAADKIQAGDSLRMSVVIVNGSKEPIDSITVTPIESGMLRIEGGVRIPAGKLPSGQAVVAEFDVSSNVDALPGKYVQLVKVGYVEPTKETIAHSVIADGQIEIESPRPSAISLPSVTLTATAFSDTLREGGKVRVLLVVENRSAFELSDARVVALSPEALKLTPDPEPGSDIGMIGPFAAATRAWFVELDPAARAGLKYGKHVLPFELTYSWHQGRRAFASRTMSTVELTATFFGAEGFSQIFGVPLNLIVFVLPGFCLLFVYSWLSSSLLGRGQTITPTTADNLFYSIALSVGLLLAYKFVWQKDLFVFFSSADLVVINVLAAAAGALVPVLEWLRRRQLDAWRDALTFRESDSPYEALIRALQLHPDPAHLPEVRVVENGVTWRGTLLSSSTSDRPLAVGAFFKIICPERLSGELDLETIENGTVTAERIERLVGDRTIEVAIARPISRVTPAGPEAEHSDAVKLVASPSAIDTSRSRPLWELELRDESSGLADVENRAAIP